MWHKYYVPLQDLSNVLIENRGLSRKALVKELNYPSSRCMIKSPWIVLCHFVSKWIFINWFCCCLKIVTKQGSQWVKVMILAMKNKNLATNEKRKRLHSDCKNWMDICRFRFLSNDELSIYFMRELCAVYVLRFVIQQSRPPSRPWRIVLA